jgi:hypothetical protein
MKKKQRRTQILPRADNLPERPGRAFASRPFVHGNCCYFGGSTRSIPAIHQRPPSRAIIYYRGPGARDNRGAEVSRRRRGATEAGETAAPASTRSIRRWRAGGAVARTVERGGGRTAVKDDIIKTGKYQPPQRSVMPPPMKSLAKDIRRIKCII